MNAQVPRTGQPQPKITKDPQRQVLCPACGSGNFKQRLTVFRLPGQVIGTVDLTFEPLIVCEQCSELVDVGIAPVRKDVEKFEAKPA